MENEKYRKAREYSRVDAHMPLQARVVGAEEMGELRSRTSNECMGSLSQTIPDLDDRVLAECMRIINSKLDTIINILSIQGPCGPALQATRVNISGNGLSFESETSYRINDTVEIRMMLPYSSDCMFYIYGDIVRVEEISHDKFNISVRFTVIDEDIRERIVKFVFEKQRELIRKQRRL